MAESRSCLKTRLSDEAVIQTVPQASMTASVTLLCVPWSCQNGCDWKRYEKQALVIGEGASLGQ